MKNLPPEQRLKLYQSRKDKDGIEAMLELISRREHQKTIKEFVK